jgi:UDP-N-acetylmuramoyl-tripeptide--D-alanyl-D-alanine ligase
VALVTGVGAAHTEGLGDVAGVAAEKLEIATGLREGGLLLVPKSDPRLAPGAGVRTETFGWEEGADLRAEAPVFRGAAGSEIRVDGRRIAVPVPGRHNARNALAAWALVRALGMVPGPGVEPLAKLGAAPLRGEIRRSPRGVNLLVDCYNANPEAVGAALETLAELAGDSRKFVVLGEMRELGALTEEAHREVGRRAAKAGASGLFLFGEAARFSAEGAREAGMDGEAINIYSTREELTRALDAAINAGDWVLIKGSRATRLDEVADALAPAAGKQDKRCCIA